MTEGGEMTEQQRTEIDRLLKKTAPQIEIGIDSQERLNARNLALQKLLITHRRAIVEECQAKIEKELTMLNTATDPPVGVGFLRIAIKALNPLKEPQG